jgi:hypothetical protein
MNKSSVFDYLLRLHPNASVVDDRTDPEPSAEADS